MEGIFFDLFAFVIGVYLREETRTVIVDVRVKKVTGKLIDLGGVFLRDMHIAEVLSDDRAVFGFSQRVIVGMTGSGFGQFDEQFVE